MGGWIWLFLAAFIRPATEAFMVAIGEWNYHTGYRYDPGQFDRLIIQITTLGREWGRVNDIIKVMHGYKLTIPYEIWVVIEPGFSSEYPGADRVIVVPADFVAVSKYKARAIEYSRHVRLKAGLNTRTTKILLLDDDTEPTKAYIYRAFGGAYDVCQGVTAPMLRYGKVSIKHFLLSHFDDMRFACCFIYCSFFQGVLQHPLYVHGEGLCMTGWAESIVEWNKPIFASEDLVFGQNAAAEGLSWGWFHEYILITSPFNFKDYLTQRRRWFWGNMHACFNPGILPLWGRIIVISKYVLGFFTFVFSATAVVLILTHHAQIQQGAYAFFWASLAAWLLIFAISGYVNSGYQVAQHKRRSASFWINRLWQTAAAVLLSPITATWTLSALIIVAIWGNPRAFHTIDKVTKDEYLIRREYSSESE